MKAGKPPPASDPSNQREVTNKYKNDPPAKATARTSPHTSDVRPSMMDTSMSDSSSSSYFTQHPPANPPFYTSTVLSEDTSRASNIPLLTAPNPHFHLSLKSAVTAATTGVPQTPLLPTTTGMSLKLPDRKMPITSYAQNSPLISPSFVPNLDNPGLTTPRPLNLKLPQADSFFSPSNAPSSHASTSGNILGVKAGPNNFASWKSTDSTKFLELQAQAAAGSSASISASLQRLSNPEKTFENPTLKKPSTFDSRLPYIPVSGAGSNMGQHHKFRSPSLPVNSLVNSIEIPSSLSAISPEELAQILKDPRSSGTALLVDIRPFNQYSTSRISSAVSICVPSTLLKRPTFTLSRFGECMMPYQREAIDNLARYKTIIIYDRSTNEVSASAYSPLVYTILKFDRAEASKTKLSYLKGGISAFQETCPSLIDDLAAQIPNSQPRAGNQNDASNKNSNTNTNIKHSGQQSHHPGHSHSNSQPDDLTLGSSTTFNFPPVLTGFSLPLNSTKEGPLKPFASNIRASLEHVDLSEESLPVSLPSDLEEDEIKSYFPLWLQDIISKETGPLHITRRFYDIEQAEKVRLQSAFRHGSQMKSSSSPMSASPDESGTKYSFSAGVELGAKNRYNNIWPYDHTRVKLPEVCEESGKELALRKTKPDMPNTMETYRLASPNSVAKKCDYFNASYITATGTSLRYIATQGPLPDTFTDFWNVVWDKKIPVIVMLTAETEGGSIKCHKYWNNGIYGTVSLTKISSERVMLTSETGTSVTIRKLVIAPTAVEAAIHSTNSEKDGHYSPDSHTVIQIQYTAWPDLGSPAYPEDLIALCRLKNLYLDEARQHLLQSSGKKLEDIPSPWTLVHCSAGCGRTGTFCTVDTAIDILDHQLVIAPSKQSKLTLSPFHSAIQPPPSASSLQMARPDDNDAFESRDLIYRTVHNFRRQRLSMVQVLRQYALCYETVILWVHAHYQEQKKLQMK